MMRILVPGDYLVVGYGLGYALTARSINAYDTPGRWWFGYVPFLNLALFFSSRNHGGHVIGRWLKGAAFCLLGLAVYSAVASLEKIAVTTVFTQNTEAANRSPAFATKIMQGLLDTRPLVRALAVIASQIQTPQRVDHVTILSRITANGKALRYEYAVSSDVSAVPASVQQQIVSAFCVGL
jgi:hypothetical protein